MPTTELPPFVWATHGAESLILETWSVRSLARFNWPHIHLISGSRREAEALRGRLDGWIDSARTALTTEVIHYRMRSDWGGSFYKPYALARSGLLAEHRRFVYCDADVLIQQDPRGVIEPIGDVAWFHKLDWNKVPHDQAVLDDPGLHPPGTEFHALATLLREFGDVRPLRWLANSGFFQLPGERAREILELWNRYTFSLDPSSLRGDQEILTIALHHLGIEPICEKSANYPMATHYLSDMKPLMVSKATADGLDPDRLRHRYRLMRAPNKVRAQLRSGFSRAVGASSRGWPGSRSGRQQ